MQKNLYKPLDKLYNRAIILYRDTKQGPQNKGNETITGGDPMALKKETKERLWVLIVGAHAIILAAELAARTFIPL